MLLSRYFLPILKENPKDASIASHILMLKAGLIRQTSSGIYAFLPLGLKVLDKISEIIKKEMNNSGAINILMPTIQSADIWKESGRYEDYGLEMLRIKDRHNRDMLYGPTAEELITQIFRDNVKTYKDLPLNLYQIHWKFRDEIRPRFGVMRGREFLMKDAYSFDLTYEQSVISYKKMFAAYLKIFNDMGLKAIPMQADTGPIGGDLSHEFMILANTGESEVFCNKKYLNSNIVNKTINYDEDVDGIFNEYTKYYASTSEKHNVNDEKFLKEEAEVVSARGIEVGHIFHFGDKYSIPLNASVLNKDGEKVNVLMGSYGIGVSRLIGALIESSHDEKGIVWHKSVAPFLVIINSLGSSEDVIKACDFLYNYLRSFNIEVLYNDKSDSASNKLQVANLIGIPYQIHVGSQTMKNSSFEFVVRKDGKSELIKITEASKILHILKS